MTATAWAIKDWNKAFETYKTRRYQSGLEFIKVPVGTQSAGYKMVMATPGGVAAYAVFVALCQTAARSDIRGMLAHDSQPMSLRRLSVETMIPADQIEAAIKILSDPEIGWLKMVEIPTDGRHVWDNDRHGHPETDEDHAETMRGACAAHPERTPDHVNGAYKTEHNQTKQDKTPPPPQPEKHAGGGGGGVEFSARFSLLQKRPPWLPSAHEWIGKPKARELARSRLTGDDFGEIYDDIQRRVNGMKNPAGVFISMCEQRIKEADDGSRTLPVVPEGGEVANARGGAA